MISTMKHEYNANLIANLEFKDSSNVAIKELDKYE